MGPFRNPRNPGNPTVLEAERVPPAPTAREIADSPLIRDLAAVLNTHSAEHLSDTPDFVLASYLNVCLLAFSRAVGARDRWLGRNPFPMQDENTEEQAPDHEFEPSRVEAMQRELGALAGHLHRQRNVLDEMVRILIVSIENRVSAQPGEIVARLKKLRELLAPDTEPMTTKES